MTEANKEISKMSETTMSETEATFSGTKRETIQVVDEYIIVTGRGVSAERALDDLETEVYHQVNDCLYTPVGGATVLYDGHEEAWVAYQTFIGYNDEKVEE